VCHGLKTTDGSSFQKPRFTLLTRCHPPLGKHLDQAPNLHVATWPVSDRQWHNVAPRERHREWGLGSDRQSDRQTARCWPSHCMGLCSVCSSEESVNNVMQHIQRGHQQNSVIPEGTTRECWSHSSLSPYDFGQRSWQQCNLKLSVRLCLRNMEYIACSGSEKTVVAWVNQVNLKALWSRWHILFSLHCLFHTLLCSKPFSYKHNAPFLMLTEFVTWTWKENCVGFLCHRLHLLCKLHPVLFFQEKSVSKSEPCVVYSFGFFVYIDRNDLPITKRVISPETYLEKEAILAVLSSADSDTESK